MTQAPPRPPTPAWRAGLLPPRAALGLFTIIPVRAGPEISRDQDPAILCRDPQYFRIESAFRNYAPGRPEVYRGLSSEQSFPNVGIDVSVSLKADVQANLAAASFLPRSKRSIISWGIGYRDLISSKTRS